jgi:hypothetical protein
MLKNVPDARIIVVCRFIGAFKNAHKWANYRYVRVRDVTNKWRQVYERRRDGEAAGA